MEGDSEEEEGQGKDTKLLIRSGVPIWLKLNCPQSLRIILCIIDEYIDEDHVSEQTHNQIAAQKIQQNILKLLQDELGDDAVLLESVSKELILQVY